MKFYINFLSTVLLLFFISGCSSAHKGVVFAPERRPSQQQSLVYFYRPWKYAGAAASPWIKEIRDQEEPLVITGLYNDTYFPYVTTPGNKKFKAQKGYLSDTIDINLKAGETYFIKFWWSFLGYGKLELSPEDEALEEIEDCNLVVK